MRSVFCQAAAFLLCLGCLIGIHAQTSTVGSISGTVRDEKGAAVAGAEVIIAEGQTGAARTVITDSDGFYSAPSLPVGRYEISTAPQGFKKTISSGVDLHVGDKLVVNLNVEVGQVSETVTVTGEAQQVETRTGDVSSLVSEKQVTELPLNGRNYASLVLMVPGVSPTNGAGGGATNVHGTGLDSHVDLSVNGNQSNANMWTVDGVNNMDVGSNATLLVFPSIDSIKEFKVERNSFSAEYGQAQGAVINLVTKGGGNEFHGTAFEFLRNDALNGTDFFLNRAGQKKGKLRYNNYGFNFNGPVVLPHFGEGGGKFKKLTNRAFFFWSEEWRAERRGTTVSGRVPTAQERVGNFSGQLTDLRPRDPFLPGRCDPKGTPGGVFTACFPGDIIPANRLSPVALSLLKVYPLPNVSGLPVDANGVVIGNNWISAPLEPVNTRQDLIRGDVTITQKMNLMVRYINETWTHGQAAGNFWGDTPFPTVSSDWDQPSNSFAVKLTNTLSSSAVNEFQFSRAGNDIIVKTNPGGDALNQEITSKFPTVFPHPGAGYPSLVWGTDGYNTLWHQAPWMNHEDLFIWKDDFSKVWGNHDLKIGALFSHNIKNELINGNSGLYFIQNSNSRTGNAMSEILLKDLPITEYSEIDNQGLEPGRWSDKEAYVNDTWKFSPHVTFTLGMRYSIYAPAYANNNHITNFIPRLYNGTDFRTALVQAGTNGFPRALVNTYHGGWQPRVGIAWDIFGNGRTALRMGAGRYMGRSNVIEDVLRMGQNPPWTTTVDSGWQGSTLSLADCPTCRSLDTINPGLRTAVAGANASTAFNAVNENFRPPDSWQWNLTLSREIMKNTVAEVSYVGNHGLHIWRRAVPFNDVVPSARLAIAQATRLNQPTQPIIDANRRLRGLGPISMSESTGDSHYHALQVWVDRRFTQRLAYQASYTWGHVISNVPLESFTNATTDPFNYDLDRGDADLDRRQSFVSNAVYVLPSFKQWGSIANHVLGDWQLNGILSLFSGVPLNVTSGANTLGLAAGSSTQRPNLVPGVPIYLHTSDPTQYLNPAAFALPGVGRNGSLGRGVVRSPGIKNVDFSINKNWHVIERVNLQFRAEMFNVFNHPNFLGIDTNLGFQNNSLDANFGRPQANFGRLSATRGPREIQFGFKFSF
ncbi:MAG: carboxypeptidase regulatory-like domain-containing protein [Pyrinomonadaceae bacterium]